MTKDDIIRMALEAGFEEYQWTSLSGDSELDRTLQVGEYPVGKSVFKLVNLVAAAEREACAQECEKQANELWLKHCHSEGHGADQCSVAIRARGQE